MSPLSKTVLFFLLFFAGLACGQSAVQVGEEFPSLSALAPAVGELPVTTGKVTIVDFWASWCAPCKESFPTYAQLHTDYAARGLLIVAVGVDENPVAFAAFVKKFHPPFAVLHDKDQHLVRQVDVPAMPTCYLLGRDGRVRFVHRGFHGAETDRAIRKEIDSLLAENSSP